MDKELAEIEGMLNRIREMLNKNEISEEQREKYEGFLVDYLRKFDETDFQVNGTRMRAAQFHLIKRLSEHNQKMSTDPLLRRSCSISLYNICTAAILHRTEYADLLQYFPLLKLPLKISSDDMTTFDASFLGKFRLKDLIEKHLNTFEPFQHSEPGAHMRIELWAPLLTDLLSFVSSKNQCSDLIAVNEMTTEMFHLTKLPRSVKFAACPKGASPLPVFMVEMAQHKFVSGTPDNSMKRLSILMGFALSELINRAGIMCPDEDLTKLRVYGILISGSIFELCVCTVVKGADGHFGFVFHSNEFHWKFSLFGEEPTIPEEEASKSVDFICNGNRSVLGTFEDMKDVEIIQHIDFKRFFLKADFNSLLEGEQAATIKDENYISSHFMEDRNLNKVCRSSLILIKFLEEMVLYYKELPDILRQAYITEQNYSSLASLTFRFPVSLPYYPKSHSEFSRPELSMHQEHEKESCLYQMYLKQFSNRHPTLPDVVNFDMESGTFIIRDHNLDITQFSRSVGDIFTVKVLEIYIAKMILDIFIAVIEIHSDGLVCGAVEPQYIVYDQIHFRFSDLPRLMTTTEALSRNVKGIYDYNHLYHIRNSKLSQRDDLTGVARIVVHSLRNQMYEIMECREHYPLLMKFLKACWSKLYEYTNYPQIDPIELLEESIPIFAEMFEGLDFNEVINSWRKNEVDSHLVIFSLRMTYKLALKTLCQLKQKDSTDSKIE